MKRGAFVLRPRRGFSLVEAALSVLLIMLVAGSFLAVLQQQLDQKRNDDTKATLATARAALLSYVAAYGRLPCPARPGTNGAEAAGAPVAGVITCTSYSGYLPAVTLGLPNTDNWGLLEGAWNDGAGSANGTYLRAIRYQIATLPGSGTPNALSSVALGTSVVPNAAIRTQVQASFTGNFGLFVCRSSTGIAGGGNRCGTAANTLAANTAAILWSLGKDAPDLANNSADENQNYNLTVARVVISRPMAPQGAGGGGRFDDLVSYIPYSEIADRLVTAGYVQ